MQNVINYVRKYPFVPLKHLQRKFNLDYHLSNISRIVRKENLNSVIARKKQDLKKASREKRLAFALANRNRNWNLIKFTDEKTMLSYHYGQVRVRRPRGQAYNKKYVFRYKQRRRFKVNLYGYISMDGKCEIFLLPDKNNAESYISVLKKAFGSDTDKDFILQEDNAPIHCARIAKAYKEEAGLNVLPDWPPYSPDLNIIETIWARMVKYVHHLIRCKGEPRFKKQLFQWCQVGFQLACHELVPTLYNSMGSRMEAVIQSKGDFTRY